MLYEGFFVPPAARWAFIRDELHDDVGNGLNKALGALEEENSALEGVLSHIDFNRKVGRTRIPDPKLRELIKHFSKYPLRNEDFEFPDLLGAAYEYLIKEFADSAGKKGGEFYTPRDVVRLMVRLVKPQQGMRIYDPAVGSGCMLILSNEYVEQHGGDGRDLGLYGQDPNGGVWAICKMNMLLHGIPDADIQNDDTLTTPLHLEGGELLRFDRVVTNPPFSQNYSRADVKFPERFRYGWCPESGKKADLMFVQHMVAVLRPGGMLATVMPHGVLFRGGEERTIRKAFIEDDLLEAVIGLPPNLFYGAGIPACILVMRTKGAKPAERKGKVLFINADAEYHAGRAQNYLRPEHIEKIVSTFEAFRDVPGYAAVVAHADLAANDFNLNIRRYADNAPPPEPHYVRAHLVGGVPRTEIAAKSDLFAAHGFDPAALFVDRDEHYVDFSPAVTDRAALRTLVESDAGVLAQEGRLRDAFASWWQAHEPRLLKLPDTRDLMPARAEMLAYFAAALTPVGLLDRFKVDGVVASWWNEAQFDLKTVAARGFPDLVDGWVGTIRAALEDTDGAPSGPSLDPLAHPLVTRVLAGYVEEVAQAEAHVADLQGRFDATKKESDEDGEEADQDEGDELLSVAEVKALKASLSAAKKKLKALQSELVRRLEQARAGLDADHCARLALDILHSSLAAELERYVSAHRREVVAAVETWWDKYRITLRDVARERNKATERLSEFLRELNYVG